MTKPIGYSISEEIWKRAPSAGGNEIPDAFEVPVNGGLPDIGIRNRGGNSCTARAPRGTGASVWTPLRHATVM